MVTKKEAEKAYNKYYAIITKKYGNKETNTSQLLKIGKKLFGNKFKGVYASDQIPIMKKNQYCIVNLDTSSNAGTHWVAVVKVNKNLTYVYDSFGRKTLKIMPSLLQSGNGIIKETENDPEQKKWMEDCGQRSIAALLVYDKMGIDGLKWI